MRTFWNFNGGIKHIDAWQPNCWVQVTCPVEEDIKFLQDELGMPDYFLYDVADTDERARFDMDEGWLMSLYHDTSRRSAEGRQNHYYM